MKFIIPKENFEKLEKKAKAIAKKCDKYNVPFNFEVVGETIKEYDDVKIPCFEVEAEGTAKNDGYEIVATIDHNENGNIINKIVNVEIPTKYRHTSSCLCEHCNTRRNRKNTCLVRNIKTNEIKQIGNSCVREYTDGVSVEIACYYAEFLSELKHEEEIHSNIHYTTYHETIDILTILVEIVNKLGYRKSSEFVSTKGIFFSIFNETKEGKDYMREIDYKPWTEENIAKAKEIIEYFADAENVNTDNDYMYTLNTLAKSESIELKHVGYLASMIPTYDKEMAKLKQKKAETEKYLNSEYVGKVGDKIQTIIDNVKTLTSWENCYDGYNTTITYLYQIVDNNKNVYIWKTNKKLETETLNGKQLNGTIKEYKEFNGVKQNVLTRCRIK